MLLFDMDGTLIDSNGIWKDVDTRFLEKRGLPYTQEYYEGVAHTIFPLAAKFTKEFCHLPESEAAIMAEWMEMAGDIYATDVTEKPGVRAYLEQMKNRGERMAVVTSAVPVHCRAALTHLGLLPYFERIFFAQELGTEKKYPALWEKVAAALGVSPADCTLFDDSVEAIRGAKAPGCTPWAWQTPTLPPPLTKWPAPVTVTSPASANCFILDFCRTIYYN